MLRGHKYHEVFNLALKKHLAVFGHYPVEPFEAVVGIDVTEEARKIGYRRMTEFQLQ